MNRRFEIAMVAACPFPYPRGTPIRVFRMAEALSRRGHKVHVVTYHLGNRAQNVPFRIHRIIDVKTYRKYSSGPTYQKLLALDSLLAVKLLEVLKTYEIDLIHAHHYEGLFVSSCVRKLTKHRLIYDAHTLLESELPSYGLGLTRRIKIGVGRRLDAWLPKMADHIISVTDDIRKKLIRDVGVLPEMITTVTNGVKPELFQPERQGHEASRSDGKKLVYTGNLASYQRIDLLLKIFNEVLKKRKDVRLIIVSNSPFDFYAPLAKKLHIFEYIDIIWSELDTLASYIADADVALNTRTDCDGIPQKLLNYMAAGKPIVSFEGSAKLIEHGINGCIVQNENVNGFAESVLSLLENPSGRQTLGDNAKKYVLAEHSWEKIAEKTESIYARVLS